MWQLTAECLRELLIYNPETGLFTNKVKRGQRGQIGAIAGSYDKDGYVVITINRQKFRAGRLAWLYMTGEWPVEVDHEDGVCDNDAWHNLRDATRSENCANSLRDVGKFGLRGVKYDPKTSTWRARIAFEGCREYVGAYDTAEEAYKAYLAAAEIRHGEFALHKRPHNPSMEP